MHENIWDQIATWLSEYTAAEQLGIMASVFLVVFVILLWVTR